MKVTLLCLAIFAVIVGVAYGNDFEKMTDEELLREMIHRLEGKKDKNGNVSKLKELLTSKTKSEKAKSAKEAFLDDVVKAGPSTRDLGVGTMTCPDGNIGSFPPQGAIIYPAVQPVSTGSAARAHYYRDRRSTRDDNGAALDTEPVLVTRCSHVITVPENRVYIIATAVSSDGGDDCSVSQLSIYEGDGPSGEPFMKLCGSTPPTLKLSKGNTAYVQFASASVDADTGFSMFWIGGD